MSDETSLFRAGLAGAAALAVAAASLAVLPQPAETAIGDRHGEGNECVSGCAPETEVCCLRGGFGGR